MHVWVLSWDFLCAVRHKRFSFPMDSFLWVLLRNRITVWWNWCFPSPQITKCWNCTHVNTAHIYTNYVYFKMSGCSAEMTALFTLNNSWNRKVLSTLNWTFHHKKGKSLFSMVPAVSVEAWAYEDEWVSALKVTGIETLQLSWALEFYPSACASVLPPCPSHTRSSGMRMSTRASHKSSFPYTEELSLLPRSGCSHQRLRSSLVCVCVSESLPLWPGRLFGALPGHLWFISAFGCCLCS